MDGKKYLLVFLLAASPAFFLFSQESPNRYYAYPLSFGAGYLPLSPIGSVERHSTLNEISAKIRIPLPFLPVLQTFVTGGLATVITDQAADPAIIGGALSEGAAIPNYDPRDTWNHQKWFGGAGIGLGYRITKEFETGLELHAAYSHSYFPQRVVTAEGDWYPVGEPGIMVGLNGKVSLNPSFNLSIDLLPAFRYRKTFGNLPDFDGFYFGLGFAVHYRFGQDPDAPRAEVRALRFVVDDIPPVFASMQKVYVRRPIAYATLTNTERVELKNLQVSFSQASYMDSPTLCAEIDSIAPNESVRVPLFASFNDAVFSTVDVVPVNGEIIASYSYRGRATEQRRSVTFNLMDRNSVVWDDDRKVAAFITPRDGAVRNYASFVGDRAAPENTDFLPKNLEIAMQAYHALGAIDIGYQPDPSSPFAAVHGTEMVVDDVSLPRETLRRGTGDCDDLTVLYNTMLESVGVPTGIVTIPGHIYSAVETGLSPREYGRIHPDRGMTLSAGDSLWVLVEITLIGRSDFMDAWETGMRQWNEYQDNEAARAFYTTRESHLEYQPVGLSETDIGLQYGDPGRFIAGFRRDRDRLANLILRPIQEQAESRNRASGWNQLGTAAARLKQYRAAEDAFTRANRLDANFMPAQINLGALRFLQNDFTGALQAFEAAEGVLSRAAQPSKELVLTVHVNIAKTLHAIGRYADAERHVALVAEIDPEEGARYRFAAAADPGGGRASSAGDIPPIRFVEEEE